eukprot:CAMPEP_0194236182 /NCGR_PEP_ID=MMETSP0158-20130606/3508_1 /TAXON_ID=33649 /ORGANISM="Thalassionema nitzschioides, Strain L26-B" /LENGTH=109 /DNA_ID=CAMNT_0038969881 /DNA_START=103 /DNA_END=429 /DNA_ORIENTATION=+
MAEKIKNAQTAPDEQLSGCFKIVAKGPSNDDDATSDEMMPQSKNRTVEWDKMFELLLQFKTKNGHCDVPQRHSEQGKYHLGNWVRTQRNKKNKDTLKKRRVDLLEQAGF